MINWLIERTILAQIVCFFTSHDAWPILGTGGLYHCRRCGHQGDVKELVL